jgi:hypothetical protein
VLWTTEVDRLLTLLAPYMVAVQKRADDDVYFLVFISGHEHRPLASISTLTEKWVNAMDLLPTV